MRAEAERDCLRDSDPIRPDSNGYGFGGVPKLRTRWDGRPLACSSAQSNTPLTGTLRAHPEPDRRSPHTNPGHSVKGLTTRGDTPRKARPEQQPSWRTARPLAGKQPFGLALVRGLQD